MRFWSSTPPLEKAHGTDAIVSSDDGIQDISRRYWSGNVTSLKFDKKKDARIRSRWIEGEALRQLRLGLSYRQIEQLKREVDVAVWDWETRKGLPHYGEDWRQTNNAHFMEYHSKKLKAETLKI